MCYGNISQDPAYESLFLSLFPWYCSVLSLYIGRHQRLLSAKPWNSLWQIMVWIYVWQILLSNSISRLHNATILVLNRTGSVISKNSPFKFIHYRCIWQRDPLKRTSSTFLLDNSDRRDFQILWRIIFKHMIIV